MNFILLSLAIKGSIVLALGALAAVLLRRSPAAFRHGIWVATFVALLAVPVLDAAGPSWHVDVLPAAASTAAASTHSALANDRRDVAVEPATIRSAHVATSSTSTTMWLGLLWALGAVAVSLVWVRGFVLGRRLVRASGLIDDRVWLIRLRNAAQTNGLRRPVALRRSEALSVPVAWGWGHQTVLLPPQSDAWDAERARAVLLHEMAHLRRRDAWMQLIAQAALVIHWPNPLAWMAYRRFLNAREQACDDAVLQVGAQPAAYASHLVAIARDLCPARLPLASVAPFIGPDDLETRIRSILDDRRRRGRASRWMTSVALALAITIGIPLAAFQPVSPAIPVLEDDRTPPVRQASEAMPQREADTRQSLEDDTVTAPRAEPDPIESESISPTATPDDEVLPRPVPREPTGPSLPVREESPPTALDLPSVVTSGDEWGFALDAPGAVRVALYTLDGRLAVILADGRFESGDHRFTLDAPDPGSYVVGARLAGESFRQRVRVTDADRAIVP